MNRSAHLEHVTAIEHARWLDPLHQPVRAQDDRHGLDFRPPRGSAWSRDDRDLVEHERGILDKDRVRQRRFFRRPDNPGAERAQRRLVTLVVGDRLGDIDGIAREVFFSSPQKECALVILSGARGTRAKRRTCFEDR